MQQIIKSSMVETTGYTVGYTKITEFFLCFFTVPSVVNYRLISSRFGKYQVEDGSALIAVLVVTMILSVLIASIMMGFLMQSRLIERDRDRIQVRYSAEAGIYQFLADTALAITPRPDSLKITLEDSSRIQLTTKPFGGYLLVSSTAHIHHQKSTIEALVGEDTLPVFNNAIVLGDIQSALTLAGASRIDGDILVGPLGTKKSEFKGELFKGEISGLIKKDSVSPLPPYNNRFYKQEISFDDSLITYPSKTALTIDGNMLDLSGRMPFKTHQVWYRSGDLTLTSDTITRFPESVTIITTGNLVIRGDIRLGMFDRCIAGKSLILADSAGGEQALLYARDSLIVKNHVHLSGQLVAGKRISISNRSYLIYPSVVYLNGYTKRNVYKGIITVGDSSRVNGTVILPKTDSLITRDSTKITVGKDAFVRGALYNSGKTELHGTVLGSVLTFQFYMYHSPTTYINWLLDATIDRGKRPDNYILPMGFQHKKRYKLITWQEGNFEL